MAGDPNVGNALSLNLQTLKEAFDVLDRKDQHNVLFEQFRVSM